MASIYKRKDRPHDQTYWAKVSRHGVVRKRCLDTSNRTIAEQRFKAWIDGLIATDWGEQPKHTFGEAALLFRQRHYPKLSKSTQKRYDVSLLALASQFSGLDLDSIVGETLSEYETVRRAAGVANPTIIRDLRCMGSIYTQAQSWGWTERNPVAPFLKGAGIKENPPRTRYLTHAEEAVLLDATKDFMRRAATILAIDTGLRQEELCGLTWGEVDFEKKQIALAASRTKANRYRAVPLHPRALATLQGLQGKARSQYVLHHGGKRFVEQRKMFLDVCARAGLDEVTWHDLRRTCGCRLLQDYKLPIHIVSRWLGHASVTVTERHYAFLRVQDIHDALAVAQGASPPNGPQSALDFSGFSVQVAEKTG